MWGLRILTGLVLLVAACDGRPHRRQLDADPSAEAATLEPHVAELDLRGGAPEAGSTGFLGGSGSESFADLVTTIVSLQSEARVKGVFVRFGSATLALARAEEFGRRMAPLRAKVPVVCHADGYGNASLLAAASACTEIWLTPAGSVEAVGLAAQLVFARALFDKLGVKVDFMQQGRFKGAEEPFTRDEPSADARTSLEGALRGMRTAWIETVERGRGTAADALGLEDGPYTASDARDRKLVDTLGFESEARQRALTLAGVQAHATMFGGGRDSNSSLGEVLQTLTGGPRLGLPHIAVVRATGTISMSSSGGLGGSDGITQASLGRVLRRLARDRNVRAVVLRIDSPGGSALASDLLWREVMTLRKEKPVVVSIGAMAASGGYYIASAASKIVAERSSIVGSIGVVMGKFAVADSLAQLGVHVTVVPAREGGGARAAYASPLVAWDDATRTKLEHAMKSTYKLFIERIAEGRALTSEAVEPAAEGRIMGGDEAKSRGLIDSIGGLGEALDLARELAHETPALPIHIEHEGTGLFELLGGGNDGDAARARLEDETVAKAAAALLAPLGPTAPVKEVLFAYAGMLRPLAQGEHALAAIPYIVSVK